MQIVEVGTRNRLPDASSEIRPVIAGCTAVPALFKVEIVRVLAVWIGKRLLKPFMLVGAVVDHQVHNDLDPPLLRLGQKLIELLHGAELRGNLIVIGNIVPLVHKGRLVDRRYPYNINTQFLQIIEFLYNSSQITDSIPIAVVKALGINLIGYFLMPPFSFHGLPPVVSNVLSL